MGRPRRKPPTPIELTDPVVCRRRRITTTVDDCETSYVNADALDQRKSPCFGCATGRRLRAWLYQSARRDHKRIIQALLAERSDREVA